MIYQEEEQVEEKDLKILKKERMREQKMKTNILKIVIRIKSLIIIAAITLSVILGYQYYQYSLDQEINMIFTMYITLELIFAIACLKVIKRISEGYKNDKRDTFNNKTYDYSSYEKEINRVKSEYQIIKKENKTNAYSAELQKKLSDNSWRLFEYELKGKIFKFRIWQDGTVYNILTEQFVGYFSEGKKRFEISRQGQRRKFHVNKIVKELYGKGK
jgi:hypothetical protein